MQGLIPHVVEADKPSQMKNDKLKEEAIRALAFPSIRAYGLLENAWMSMTLLRVVSAARPLHRYQNYSVTEYCFGKGLTLPQQHLRIP